jgi:hypothetical protein
MDNIPIEIWNSSKSPAKAVKIEFDSEVTVVEIKNQPATEFSVSGNGSKQIGIVVFVDDGSNTGNNKLKLRFESAKSPTLLGITWINKDNQPYKMSADEIKRINGQFRIPSF